MGSYQPQQGSLIQEDTKNRNSITEPRVHVWKLLIENLPQMFSRRTAHNTITCRRI